MAVKKSDIIFSFLSLAFLFCVNTGNAQVRTIYYSSPSAKDYVPAKIHFQDSVREGFAVFSGGYQTEISFLKDKTKKGVKTYGYEHYYAYDSNIVKVEFIFGEKSFVHDAAPILIHKDKGP